MALYAMADFHLSLSSGKPMDIFGSTWENHVRRIRDNWPLREEDTIVIPGDVSWAMNFSELEADFDFLASLPGKKIISKGNHDYWWGTLKKMNEFAAKYKDIFFLHNNSYRYENISICGTRGWIQENDSPADMKVLLREAARLENSIASASGKPVVFLHYPPLFAEQENRMLIDVMKKHGVERCYYGHLHGKSFGGARTGNIDGIFYTLISADYLNFTPVLVG